METSRQMEIYFNNKSYQEKFEVSDTLYQVTQHILLRFSDQLILLVACKG